MPMNDVVVVDAVRTPFGRRGGGLSGAHALDVLGAVQRALFDRTGIDPAEVGQVVGGCVGQVGMQSMNVTRGAWLTAGLPLAVPAITIDAQCGSSQHATGVAHALVAAGLVDVAVACGVELMSRVPMGSSIPKDPDVGKPVNQRYWQHHEFTSQYEGAERIAERWEITRAHCDEFGQLSQDRAAAAWAEDRFATQLVPIEQLSRDEGLRSTTLEGLAGLRPTGRPDGVHTAGTSSQIADGAAAVLLMSRSASERLGVTPLATIVDSTLVGCDPVLMLEGPIPATRRLLTANGLKLSDIDIVEINEAFASVVLAWQRELGTDLDGVNPNGGAIAMGHPLGATGAALLTKAVHELQRADVEHALVTMCCGGGLGTGTLLRRG
jgi:acetyl-CoA C-acetyltransferase